MKVLQDRMIPYVLNRPELFFDSKMRVGASISVGGAEPAWTPMGISMTNMFLLYTRVIVEQQLVNFASQPGVVTLNEKALKRARDLGRHIAIAAGTPIGKVRFMGEIITTKVPGGGGWGDPLNRNVEKVRDDVMDGVVSLQRAREVYGVLLDPEIFEIQHEATDKLRRGLKAKKN